VRRVVCALRHSPTIGAAPFAPGENPRKLAQPITEEKASEAIGWLALLTVVPIDATLVMHGTQISRSAQLSYWDGLVVVAATRGGCQRLLSEDLNDGQQIGSVRVENPSGPVLRGLQRNASRPHCNGRALQCLREKGLVNVQERSLPGRRAHTSLRRSKCDGNVAPLLLGCSLAQLTLDPGADLGELAVVARPDEDDACVRASGLGPLPRERREVSAVACNQHALLRCGELQHLGIGEPLKGGVFSEREHIVSGLA
jgi:hypothetical protein